MKIDQEQLRRHFADEMTLSVYCVTNKHSRFLAFDLDECFDVRRPLLLDQIAKYGLDAATITTTGSRPGRGKIIVFFAKPRVPAALRALGEDIAVAAGRGTSAWGVETSTGFTVYPLRGEGGALRIGGRNRDVTRAATAVDRVMDPDGTLAFFSSVTPAVQVRHPRLDPIPIGPPGRLPAYVEIAEKNGIIVRGVKLRSHGEVARWRHRLAKDIVTFHGGPTESAKYDFEAREQRVRLASKWLTEPSPTRKDRRHAFDRTGDAYGAAVCAWRDGRSERECYITNVAPLAPTGLRNVTSAADRRLRVLDALWKWTEEKNLPRDGFAVSLRTIAKATGLRTAMQVQRDIDYWIREGRIVRHDNGARGERGLPAQYGLVREGQTPDQVLKSGSLRYDVRIRPAVKAQHEEKMRLKRSGKLHELREHRVRAQQMPAETNDRETA